MYRVELKDGRSYLCMTAPFGVPNVPCGVESSLAFSISFAKARFLMYRVELKVSGLNFTILPLTVFSFLMYRVELKVFYKDLTGFLFWIKVFLMYRVELKVA